MIFKKQSEKLKHYEGEHCNNWRRTDGHDRTGSECFPSRWPEIKNVNRLVIGNLNINSIARKFDQLKAIIQGHVDILIVVETKLDSTYPTSQFLIDGYSKPYRLDRNRNGGGVLIYVREDIPTKQLFKHNFPCDIEGMFIEINLRKTKWLLLGTYHPPSQEDSYYFDTITRALDIYGELYNKLLLP